MWNRLIFTNINLDWTKLLDNSCSPHKLAQRRKIEKISEIPEDIYS